MVWPICSFYMSIIGQRNYFTWFITFLFWVKTHSGLFTYKPAKVPQETFIRFLFWVKDSLIHYKKTKYFFISDKSKGGFSGYLIHPLHFRGDNEPQKTEGSAWLQWLLAESEVQLTPSLPLHFLMGSLHISPWREDRDKGVFAIQGQIV